MASAGGLPKHTLLVRKPPEVVVLGDSQLGPVAGADAYVYNRTVDVTGDHRSNTVEHDLKLILHKDWHVLIGALPDGMMSDALIASRALFTDHYKPKLVALALSPKEFVDSRYRSIESTESFFTFSGVKSLPASLEEIRFKSCDHRSIGDNSYGNFCPLHFSNPFERVLPGEIAISSGDGYVVTDDTKKYRKIYGNPMSAQLKEQLNYLDALCKYLWERNIQTIAIELPLSAANHSLLPENLGTFIKREVACGFAASTMLIIGTVNQNLGK